MFGSLLLFLFSFVASGLKAGLYHKDTSPGEPRVALKLISTDSSTGPTVERRGYICSISDPVHNATTSELQSFRLSMTKAGSSSSVVLLFRVLEEGRMQSWEKNGGKVATWGLALRRIAEVAIIIDTKNEQERKDADKFASGHLKRLVLRGFPIRKWGSVVAQGLECPTHQQREDPNHTADKIVGITMAHKRIWEDFAARNANQTASDNSPFLIVFERDALCAVEDCGNHALNAIQSAREDLIYLGWCWQKLPTGDFPRCAHAYAVSARGAKILNNFVKICGEHVDYQIAVAEEKALITWKLTEAPSDAKPLLNLSERLTHGLFIQDWGEHRSK